MTESRMDRSGLTARVFNIERFSGEDGPGIRTVVFLKGCALRCLWCANPESQRFEPEILFLINACEACGRCETLCPRGAIKHLPDFGFISEGGACLRCGECVKHCYANARSVAGVDCGLEELKTAVLRDEKYYLKSGGGVTLSGGEPLFYHAFIRAFFEEMRERGIGTLVETCGHVPLRNIQNVAEYTDIFFFDVKHMDADRHKALTGADNRLILSNLQWLDNFYTGFLAVRYPYIPGYNDGTEDIRAFLAYVASMKRVAEVWFLPYHRLGGTKYRGLGRFYPMEGVDPLRVKDLEFLKSMGKEYGLNVRT
jgi:pyruvate formate lyase activating enzyme